MTKAPWRRWHVTFTCYRTDGWRARSGGQHTPFPWWELQAPVGTLVASYDRTLTGWSPPVTPTDGRPVATTIEPRWHIHDWLTPDPPGGPRVTQCSCGAKKPEAPF
jgi:hypothetical protein